MLERRELYKLIEISCIFADIRKNAEHFLRDSLLSKQRKSLNNRKPPLVCCALALLFSEMLYGVLIFDVPSRD